MATLTTQRQRLGVLVCSDQALVVESVCAALADRGLDATGMVGFEGRDPAATGVGRCQAAVLLADLVSGTSAWSALSLLEAVRLPWVVVTGLAGADRARLAATGAAVLPTSTTLEDVVHLLGRLSGPADGPVEPCADLTSG